MKRKIDNPKMNKSSLENKLVCLGCSNRVINISSSKIIHTQERIKKEILSKVPKINTFGEKSR